MLDLERPVAVVALVHRGGPIAIDESDGVFAIEYSVRCREHGVTGVVAPRFQAIRREAFSEQVGINTTLRDQLSRRYLKSFDPDPYYSKYMAQTSSRHGQLGLSAEEHPEVCGFT